MDLRPSLGRLTCGFDRRHGWSDGSTQSCAHWLARQQKPTIVVAGHQLPGDPQSPAALEFTRDYIVTFDKAAATAKTSRELTAIMQTRFPNAHDVLGGFILGNSAKVGVGETPPWDE